MGSSAGAAGRTPSWGGQVPRAARSGEENKTFGMTEQLHHTFLPFLPSSKQEGFLRVPQVTVVWSSSRPYKCSYKKFSSLQKFSSFPLVTIVWSFLSFLPCLSLVLAGSRELSKREECRLFLFLSVASFAYRLFLFSVLLSWTGGTRRAVWLKLSPRPMLSPAVLLKLSPHAFVCLCLSPVASSPRSRALSSSAFPVLLGF
jgi:hypothetical protein